MSRRIAPTVDASLRDNPFHPALANHDVMTTQGALPTGRSDNLACYVLPANASKESILDLAYACSLACTSAQAPLAHRKNLFLTCTNIMVPGSIKRLPKGMVKAVKLAPATLTNLRRIFQECNEANKSDDYHIPENALENFTIHKTLPTLQPNIACDNITYCRKKKSLYAHFALVIFQAGKLITDANRSAVTTARPKALIEKYKITGVEILTGAARISNYGHEFIHQAYLEMSAFPGECFKEFSKYATSPTNAYQDMINVIVMLLRFAKMQHVVIINKFLKAYPWVAEMIELKQSLAVYGDSIEALCSLPASLQPYVKLIYGVSRF